MSHKYHKPTYLFVSVDYKNRLVKISAVTNIVAFRNMMKNRYPSYDIINDHKPFTLRRDDVSNRLHHKIMNLLNEFKCGTEGEYRTYSLDSYRVRTVIRLLVGGNTQVIGHDDLVCQSCGNRFDGDYGMINDIYKFVNLNVRYCSDDCLPQATRSWNSGQRYCRCGVIFYPTSNTDFYCNKCLNSV